MKPAAPPAYKDLFGQRFDSLMTWAGQLQHSRGAFDLGFSASSSGAELRARVAYGITDWLDVGATAWKGKDTGILAGIGGRF